MPGKLPDRTGSAAGATRCRGLSTGAIAPFAEPHGSCAFRRLSSDSVDRPRRAVSLQAEKRRNEHDGPFARMGISDRVVAGVGDRRRLHGFGARRHGGQRGADAVRAPLDPCRGAPRDPRVHSGSRVVGSGRSSNRHARPSAKRSWARAVASWKSVWTTCAAAFEAAICASPSSITLPDPFW